ncbi:unnamed protein product [Polarella glacialis]|uniref:Protein kinase domain-containing protein n=1 Tax=Polarella glacialis TaxID=89957 RepID=A0A813H980_POLGL|nr:unnamed protein product [Polarella glacialis]
MLTQLSELDSVAFNPNGGLLASGSRDNTVKVFATSTWAEVTTLAEHTKAVTSVAFNPDGGLLASGSADGTVKVFATSTWAEVRTLAEHTNYVDSVAFNPDGGLLASGSRDNTVKVLLTAAATTTTTTQLLTSAATTITAAATTTARAAATTAARSNNNSSSSNSNSNSNNSTTTTTSACSFGFSGSRCDEVQSITSKSTTIAATTTSTSAIPQNTATIITTTTTTAAATTATAAPSTTTTTMAPTMVRNATTMATGTITALKVKGTMALDVPNCTAFTQMEGAIGAVAAGIANATGVDAKSVQVTLTCSRRLSSDGLFVRRLEAVNGAYEITIPVPVPTTITLVPTTGSAGLTAQIAAAMTAAGITDITVKVNSISTPTVQAIGVATTTAATTAIAAATTTATTTTTQLLTSAATTITAAAATTTARAAATTAARSNNNNNNSSSSNSNSNNNSTTTTTTRAPTATAATATAATTTASTATLSKALLSTAGSLLCCVSLCFGVWLWRRARAARNRQEAAAAADMPKIIGDAATDLWGPESSVSVYVVDASGLSVADPSVESCSEGAFQSSDMQHIMTIGIVEHWFIKPSDITPGPKSILGSGSFAIVVKGMLNHATEVAIKIPKTRFQSREESQLANEMRLFRHIRHSNIVLFHGATLMVINCGSPCLSLVLEWVDGGNFGEYMQQLRSNAVFEADGHAFAYKILLDVARGMTYLHKLTPVILHLDLKPANILVEKSVPPKGKITDFGLSRFARNSLPQPKVGTEKYMAPEVAHRKPYGPAADVFSFGRVIIWTITGELCPELISSTSSKGQQDACLFQTLDEVASSCLEGEPHMRPHFFQVYDRLTTPPPPPTTTTKRVPPLTTTTTTRIVL